MAPGVQAFRRILGRLDLASVLEVGSNIGLNLLFIQEALNRKARLLAVEPNRKAYRRLTANHRLCLENAWNCDAFRLPLADAYFREGGETNFILAIPAYRDFLTIYPSHPRSDEAQFQVAEGFFAQRNGPDRDQTPTRQALEEYGRLMEFYPASPRVELARERYVEATYSKHGPSTPTPPVQ